MTILLGDIHFGKNGFSLETYDNQMKFYKEQLFPYIVENKIKRVVSTGDFFDHRTRQDVNLLIKIKNEFLKFFIDNDVELIVLVGNHDMYFKDSREVCTLDLFEHIKQLKIIKNKTLIKLGNIEWELYPWITSEEFFEPRSKYVIGHFEINGFTMSGTYTCTHGMNPNSLKNMDMVISGHFHNQQIREPIYYIGTPYAMDWNDVNEDKGFWLLDDNAKLEFVSNIKSKKYYEFNVIQEDGVDYYTIGENKFNYKHIDDLSKEKHFIRLKSDTIINVSENSNIIVSIEHKDEVDDAHDDIDRFVRESLTDDGYKEFTKLFNEIQTDT